MRIIAWISIIFLVIVCTCSVALLFSVNQEDTEYAKNRKTIMFRIDSDFDSDELVCVKKALIAWNTATNHYVNLTYHVMDISWIDAFYWGQDNIPTIYKASGADWKTINFWYFQAGKSTAGLAMTSTADIFIWTKDTVEKTPDQFRCKRLTNLLIHEIGHIMLHSSWHSKNKSSVMFNAIGPHDSILDEEIDKVRSIK